VEIILTYFLLRDAASNAYAWRSRLFVLESQIFSVILLRCYLNLFVRRCVIMINDL
jgi:hypothetical protein